MTGESVAAPLVRWIVLSLAGALSLTLGYLISYRERYRLIAGYDPESDDDPAALARDVGGLGIAVGALLFGTAIFAVLARPGESFWTAFAVVLTALCVVVPFGIHLRHD